jgi:branched-chain amino acid transport system ATP-binding protein
MAVATQAPRAVAEAIRTEHVSVAYGGFRALSDVNLSIPAGQRRAIIGPNGAGKTTLLKCISGALAPSGGHIWLLGHDVTRLPEHHRTRRGIGRTYQITNLFRHLTVIENAVLATQGLSPVKWNWFRAVEKFHDVHGQALQYLQRIGLDRRAGETVSNLSYGEQRQLELALALASRPSVLLLDEPAAGLSPAERQTMAAQIATIDRDITIVMIEHNMDLVMSFADEITVLHHGEVVAEGTPADIRSNDKVRQVYLGDA